MRLEEFEGESNKNKNKQKNKNENRQETSIPGRRKQQVDRTPSGKGLECLRPMKAGQLERGWSPTDEAGGSGGQFTRGWWHHSVFTLNSTFNEKTLEDCKELT